MSEITLATIDSILGATIPDALKRLDAFENGGRPANDNRKILPCTPFVVRDPKLIPRRPWLYGTTYLRKELTSTFSPSGIGKTSLALVEALSWAFFRKKNSAFGS